MKVTSFVRYLKPDGAFTPRQHDWDAYKLVYSLKRYDFTGYAAFSSEGVSVHVDASHGADECQARAIEAVATVLAPVVRSLAPSAVLVPVPSSTSTVSAPVIGPPSLLARSIVQKLAGRYWSVDALAFAQVMQSARTGGERDAKKLLPSLQVIGAPWDASIPVIIVDDVLTLGGHMHASAECLRRRGYNVIGGVVAARTVVDQQVEPLGLMHHSLQDPFSESTNDPFADPFEGW